MRSIYKREKLNRNISIIDNHLRVRRLLFLLTLCLTIFLGIKFLHLGSSDTGTSTERVQTTAQAATIPENKIEHDVFEGTVKKGETITGILGSRLTPGELHNLAIQCKPFFPLNKICAGHSYVIRTIGENLFGFDYEINKEEKLIVRTRTDGFSVSRDSIVYDKKIEVVKGTIASSLFAAVREIGEAPELAIKLSDIFGWDVDFILDIRGGDSFSAVVEKRYRSGSFYGYGRILAAEFINQGKKYQGFLYGNGNDGEPTEYYDPQGKNLRKAFLKAPLKKFRISSGFSWRRFHPIKKVWRPHPAIDYAAPIGTPIRAVGDGVIKVLAYHKASGRYIKIRHNSVYETGYLHLSRFAKGLRRGKKVAQGQVIGYVGSSGLSTGPHLDFRMKKNGKYVDPRKIKIPSAKSVSKGEVEEFKQSIEPLIAYLDGDDIPSVKTMQ